MLFAYVPSKFIANIVLAGKIEKCYVLSVSYVGETMRECTFDQNTFAEPFYKDLANARLSVIIQSPYLSDYRILQIVPKLEDLAKRKIPVCLFVQKPEMYDCPEEWKDEVVALDHSEFTRRVEKVQAMSAHVNIKEQIHEKVIVIDFGILYDGSMNAASYNQKRTSERMTRREDAYKSLQVIARHALDACYFCKDRPANEHPNIQAVNKLSVGKALTLLRKGSGLSQQELAISTHSTRQNVGRIESAKRLPSLGMTIDICDICDYALVMVPKYSLPYVSDVVRLIPKPYTPAKNTEMQFQPACYSRTAASTPQSDDIEPSMVPPLTTPSNQSAGSLVEKL